MWIKFSKHLFLVNLEKILWKIGEKTSKKLEEKITRKGSGILGFKFSYILSLVNLGKHWSLFSNGETFREIQESITGGIDKSMEPPGGVGSKKCQPIFVNRSFKSSENFLRKWKNSLEFLLNFPKIVYWDKYKTWRYNL